MKKEIENRADLELLITSFYNKIREDKEIGSFFNSTISDWESHLEKLIDFWENNLFAKKKYFGNPIEIHQKIDLTFNKTITPSLFGIWLNYWFETLEELFFGENVAILKQRARKMGTLLLVKIYENRDVN
jgi:hemoglobin